MWSIPVTLGGGMTMQKGGRSLVSCAWKYRFFSQCSYHFASTSFDS